MKQHNTSFWKSLPWIVVLLSVFNMWRTILMNLSDIPNVIWGAIIGAAATVVAPIIAGAVALIGQWRQAKHDGKSLESISSKTSEMKPKVDDIDSTIKDISKDITKIEDRSKQINSIASAVESFKFMKDCAAGSAMRPEELLAQMSNVFEERANLSVQHERDQTKIDQLTQKNDALTRENQRLRNEILLLNKKLEPEQKLNAQNAHSTDYEYIPTL